MSDVVWVVERCGVHKQGVLGVFRTLVEAKRAVEQHLHTCRQESIALSSYRDRSDADGYHSFEIAPYFLGSLPKEVAAHHEYFSSTTYDFDFLQNGWPKYTWRELLEHTRACVQTQGGRA